MSQANSDSKTTRPPILRVMDECGSAVAALMPSELEQPRVVALAQEIDRLRNELRIYRMSRDIRQKAQRLTEKVLS